jgi:hypothetical protein
VDSSKPAFLQDFKAWTIGHRQVRLCVVYLAEGTISSTRSNRPSGRDVSRRTKTWMTTRKDGT